MVRLRMATGLFPRGWRSSGLVRVVWPWGWACVRLGVGDFTIFEQQSGIGGTWWDNVYPGAEVDTPQPLYSFCLFEV